MNGCRRNLECITTSQYDHTCKSICCCNTHTHPFNGPFSGTTRVRRYQKGKTNLDFTEARDSEWQWHHLGRMQVCTSLQTDNHASTPPLSFHRPDALPATQPTASKHWRHQHFFPNSGGNQGYYSQHLLTDRQSDWDGLSGWLCTKTTYPPVSNNWTPWTVT